MNASGDIYGSYVSSYLRHVRGIEAADVARLFPMMRHYYLRRLPRDREAQILEIGCGYGPFIALLAHEGYKNVEGIDLSPQQVELAHRLGHRQVIQEEASKYLEGKDAVYDAIVMIDAIEHVPKPQVLPLLRSIRRALRPGGVLLLQTPNGASPFAGRHRYIDFTHEFALTPHSARQILESSGLSDVKTYGSDPFVHGPTSLLRAGAWALIKGVLWTYMVVETGVTRGHVFTQNLIITARRAEAS